MSISSWPFSEESKRSVLSNIHTYQAESWYVGIGKHTFSKQTAETSIQYALPSLLFKFKQITSHFCMFHEFMLPECAQFARYFTGWRPSRLIRWLVTYDFWLRLSKSTRTGISVLLCGEYACFVTVCKRAFDFAPVVVVAGVSFYSSFTSLVFLGQIDWWCLPLHQQQSLQRSHSCPRLMANRNSIVVVVKIPFRSFATLNCSHDTK